MNWRLNELLDFTDKQKQLYKELIKHPDTWDEVLNDEISETKEEWLFAELFTFIKFIEDLEEGE